jgi:hypothetical protein
MSRWGKPESGAASQAPEQAQGGGSRQPAAGSQDRDLEQGHARWHKVGLPAMGIVSSTWRARAGRLWIVTHLGATVRFENGIGANRNHPALPLE